MRSSREPRLERVGSCQSLGGIRICNFSVDACAFFGAVSVQVALFFSCPWGGAYMTLLWEVGEGSRGS